MSIVRIRKTEKYSVIANEPISDKSLSWGARGMLAYLLSKPNDWQVRMTDLEKQSPAGVHATKTLVHELEKAGYMKRERIRDEGGKFYWLTTVYEKNISTIPQFSIDGLSTDGKPRDIISTDGINTDVESSNDDSPPPEKVKSEYVQRSEKMESVFAKYRGCPLPDWDNNPKAANKRWRTPLNQILKLCGGDLRTACSVIREVTENMRDEHLTFDAPDQILKTARSWIIDQNNGEVPGQKINQRVPEGV